MSKTFFVVVGFGPGVAEVDINSVAHIFGRKYFINNQRIRKIERWKKK
jgi:hypothetical protein